MEQRSPSVYAEIPECPGFLIVEPEIGFSLLEIFPAMYTFDETSDGRSI
jgi:hypothetical protein